jgi:hypothetical protein
MTQILRTVAATFVLLFSIHSAQASPMPIADENFGLLGNGTANILANLPDSDPNIVWFEFTLGATQNVTLDTYGSIISARDDINGNPLPANDTILALYDSTGSLLDQNDDCDLGYESCLDFIGLVAGTYLAGLSNTFFPFEFIDMWDTDISLGLFNVGDGQVNLNITVSAVPVPAAAWLFGTALIGFVGLSRRRSVKS